MKKKLGKGQQGSVAVMVAILLPVILGCAGLAIDIGSLVLTKTKLRNAVDSAIHAGALQLPDQAAASSAVTTYLSNNGFSDITPTITYSQDAARNPSNFPEINITAAKSVATDLLGVFSSSLKSVTLTVSAEAVSPVQTLQPPFTYLLFNGSTTETLRMNGSSHDNGSIHSNYKVDVNGSSVISGNIEGVKGVSMNGSESVSGYVQADVVGDISIHGSENIGGGLKAGAAVIAMPDFTDEIIAATQAADKHTGDFTFNGSNANGHTVYVKGGDLTINGSCTWTGSLLCEGGNITINGSSQIMGTNQMFLYAVPDISGKGGNITVNGSSAFGSTTAGCIGYAPGIVSNAAATGGKYAPGAAVPGTGTIIVNGSSTWYGRVIGDTITLNGSGNFDGTHVNNAQALPYGVAVGNKRPQIIM